MPDTLTPKPPPYCDDCGWPIGAKCLICGEEVPTGADPFHILFITTKGTNNDTGETGRSEFTAAIHASCHAALLERLHQTQWHPADSE
jgi:hypothetical protein